MGKILAIGGGEIGRPGTTPTTIPIEKEIIRLTGKVHPTVLFIPTASSDSDGYIQVVKAHFGGRLGCNVETLKLISDPPSYREIATKIDNADAIYVGGGNTLKMMRRWRYLGVDKLIRQAYSKGTVLSGLSAGAICWFSQGHSDSMRFYTKDAWQYVAVKGLGFVDATFCPHYAGETRGKPRSYHFKKMIARDGGIGIGVTDNAALEIVDGKYRIITSQKDEHAYLVYRNHGKMVEKEIPQSTQFQPLDELLRKK